MCLDFGSAVCPLQFVPEVPFRDRGWGTSENERPAGTCKERGSEGEREKRSAGTGRGGGAPRGFGGSMSCWGEEGPGFREEVRHSWVHGQGAGELSREVGSTGPALP